MRVTHDRRLVLRAVMRVPHDHWSCGWPCLAHCRRPLCIRPEHIGHLPYQHVGRPSVAEALMLSFKQQMESGDSHCDAIPA